MSDAIDPAKEVVQELHGLIRDGRRLERDLKTALQEAQRDITSLGMDTAKQYVEELNQLLKAHVAQISTAIDKANDLLSLRATELAGMETPAEFLENIIRGLTPRVAVVLEDTVTRAAAEAAAKACKELHAPQRPMQGRKRQPDKLPPAVVTPILPSSDPSSLLIHRRG